MHVYGKPMRDVRKIKGRLNVKLHVYFQAFKKKRKKKKSNTKLTKTTNVSNAVAVCG